ncbi:MAG: helix-turn-helix domain-containing protein [Nocardioides sp.]|uniref:helix-turn-helix domain-containing protein n=1 Tax=Nocardioides sp. TaxID=35761 RepID=UPI003D6A2FAD
MGEIIDSAMVPPSVRRDFVREVAAAHWVTMDVTTDSGEDCLRAHRGDLGVMSLAMLSAGEPVSSHRPQRLIDQDDRDLVEVLLPCGPATSAYVEQCGKQTSLSPGDMTVVDLRRPSSIRVAAGAGRSTVFLTLMIPASLLPVARSRHEGLFGARIPASAGIGDLTTQFLMRLVGSMDHITRPESVRLSTVALEVLGTRLARIPDRPDRGAGESHRYADLTAAQSFILKHLGSADLTPSAIAAVCHVSLRHLQQVFHDEGLTVAGWIRDRRLAACRDELADPDQTQRPISAVAARWGFVDRSHFSRAFRAAYGLAPGEFRRSALLDNRTAR